METLPGVKAWSLLEVTTKSGVISYFNIRWEERNNTTISIEKLRDALDHNSDASYADFLRYIERSELMRAEAEVIGEGAHGKV